MSEVKKLASQMYQVVGALATNEVFNDPEVIRAMDYLHGIASGEISVNNDFLPFTPDNNETYD